LSSDRKTEIYNEEFKESKMTDHIKQLDMDIDNTLLSICGCLFVKN